MLNFPKVLETVIECSPYLLSLFLWLLATASISFYFWVFWTSFVALCGSALHRAFTNGWHQVLVEGHRADFRVRGRAVLAALSQKTEDTTSKSTSLCVNALLKNPNRANEQPKEAKHSVVPCPGEPPWMMGSVKFSASSMLAHSSGKPNVQEYHRHFQLLTSNMILLDSCLTKIHGDLGKSQNFVVLNLVPWLYLHGYKLTNLCAKYLASQRQQKSLRLDLFELLVQVYS